jgi:polysaccharide pyruvyl transferase WcaK-like protein
MKITFITTFDGINVGDEFIREGIKLILDQILPEYEPYYVSRDTLYDIARNGYDEIHRSARLKKVMNADLLIWAGGPIFWKNTQYPSEFVSTSYNVGWYNLWEEVLKRKEQGKKNILLGAGSCQRYADETGQDFLQDEKCVNFAKSFSAAQDLITTRDTVANEILKSLGVENSVLPCPSFCLGDLYRNTNIPKYGNVIAVNLMPGAGHFRLESEDRDRVSRWHDIVKAILPEIRSMFHVLFVAHSPNEVEFMEEFLQPGENIIYSHNWQDYLPIYSRCSFVLSNRIHASVCAAGFGIPSLLVGSDSRLRVGQLCGVPSYHVLDATIDSILNGIRDLVSKKEEIKSFLINWRTQTTQSYIRKLKSFIE